MTNSIVTCKSDPSANHIDLDVQISGTSITVGDGHFVLEGKDYSLDESSTYQVESKSSEQTVIGYLVVDTSSQKVEVLVDEILKDGFDAPYDFSDGAYSLLHRLFEISVAEGSTDFDCTVLKIAEE